MARTGSSEKTAPAKQGRIRQVRDVFAMTRQVDKAVVWWMLLAFVGTVAFGWLLGAAFYNAAFTTVLSIPLALMVALLVMSKRAERAAFAQIAGRPGAVGASLGNLRRNWSVEQEPVAVDPRTQDMVFRAVGRPGVVLVTEGPLPRVNRLAESERKRLNRVLGDSVPVTIVNAGDGDGQIPLRKVGRVVMRKKPVLTKNEVSVVAKRLRALGGVRLPIPKGIDPTRTRPDRKATRGR